MGSLLLGIKRYLICLERTHVEMAERTGFEPATPGVTGRYSNLLNYRSDADVVGVAGIEPATYGL